jgi:hypothetical protein
MPPAPNEHNQTMEPKIGVHPRVLSVVEGAPKAPQQRAQSQECQDIRGAQPCALVNGKRLATVGKRTTSAYEVVVRPLLGTTEGKVFVDTEHCLQNASINSSQYNVSDITYCRMLNLIALDER